MDKLDFLLVLIVNPGFKGQPVIPRTLEKLRLLRKLRDSRGLSLRFLVDGAVTPENLIEIVEAGADDIVCRAIYLLQQSSRRNRANARVGEIHPA